MPPAIGAWHERERFTDSFTVRQCLQARPSKLKSRWHEQGSTFNTLVGERALQRSHDNELQEDGPGELRNNINKTSDIDVGCTPT